MYRRRWAYEISRQSVEAAIREIELLSKIGVRREKWASNLSCWARVGLVFDIVVRGNHCCRSAAVFAHCSEGFRC